MELTELVEEFENSKKRIEFLIKDDPKVLSIFRTELGDGFFYASPNKLAWKYGGTGHDEEATPENLLEAYREYKSSDMEMEEALIRGSQALNYWYKEFNN
ncbi:hypothetical protein KAS08_04785 [Candidatus Pacearchaeota archaeon]|nr:hypothetical protein [Candidatus Pacearchaeota archaeon]